MSYAEVSARLGIPARSIGPTRRRCLDKLRRYPAIAALISSDPRPRGEVRSQSALLRACYNGGPDIAGICQVRA